PPAFDEHPVVRNFYIRAFLGNAFDRMTHQAVQRMLDGFALSRRHEDDEIQIARTLATVERRLGVTTTGFITTLFTCDVCWATYEPHQLFNLPEDGLCEFEGCSGRLFKTKRTSDGETKRQPVKTMPFVEPQKIVAHLLSRPGKFNQLQLWRKPEDHPGQRAPEKTKGYAAFDDLDQPMNDVYDGWGWRAIQAGLQRHWDGNWKLEDVDYRELNQQFVALPCGLVWQMNIDWYVILFTVTNGNHSTGAVYLTLCNNPRGLRYLREETALVLVIPGPDEPSLEQLNECIKFIVRGMRKLYSGEKFFVHGKPNRVLSHSFLWNNLSDLPASRKAGGLAAHNSKVFMCPSCYAQFDELTDHKCFDTSQLKLRSDARYLKYSYRARQSEPEDAELIFQQRGVRWSVLNLLPGWEPSGSSPVDFMHCVMLGMIKHVTRVIFYNHGMFNSAGRGNTMLVELEEFFDSIIWPTSVGRLPSSIAYGKGSVKADQWRSQISVLPLALYVIWGLGDGTIADEKAPPSGARTNLAKSQANSEKLVRNRMMANLLVKHPDASEQAKEKIEDATMDRSYRRHYEALLEFTSAIRILATRSLSPADVKRAFTMLRRAIQSWAQMHAHLTPYFHFAIHMEDQFLKYGPAYSWWTYPYERNNGFLGRFNHNGHTGGEIEGTMMRGWWKSIFIQKLISHFEELPELAFEDEDSLRLLKSSMKGDEKERRGTLQVMLTQLAAEQHQRIMRYYNLVFKFLRALWVTKFNLRPDVELDVFAPRVSFSGKITSYSHFFWQERRYGISRGAKASQYAFIDDRVPVCIHHIFEAVQPSWNDQLPPAKAQIAIVQRFVLPAELALLQFPWDLRAVDLGYQVWLADHLAEPEVVELRRFSGHFILAPVTSQNKKLWVTISYDHVSITQSPLQSISNNSTGKTRVRARCINCAKKGPRGLCIRFSSSPSVYSSPSSPPPSFPS
ncbi:hypothetical protein BDN72DRAFT_777946, partial [Pluteus cervinus]